MKTHPFFRLFLPLTLSVLLNTNAHSQMKVELGNDTTFCAGLYNNTRFYIAPKVKITNGVEPFSYAWKTTVSYGTSKFTAKSFLNDTTLSNPYFKDKHLSQDWVKYFLIVKDKNGNTAKDSINVRFSIFGYTTANSVVNLKQGDSIQISGSGVGGGISPLKFDHWEPSTGLTTPKSQKTWCKPSKTTSYASVFTDAVGCISSPSQNYEIRIILTNIPIIQKEGKNIIYQQKTAVYFPNEMHEPATVTVFTLNGQKLFSELTTAQCIDLGSRLSRKGIYLIQVKLEKEKLSCKYVNQ